MSAIIPGLYGLDSVSAWRALSKDPDKYVNNFAKDKTVQKEVDYFNSKVGSFKTADDLFKDKRALKFVLDSFGLGDEADNLGRIKKVLTEDPTASGALSSQLADSRFATMAKALRLDQGTTKLQTLTTAGTMKTNYIQNEFEEALGDQDPALRQAAYFARSTGNISDIYSVLGDKIMRDVVTSTFSMPKELAIQPIETQAAAVARRVDVKKFINGTNTTVTATQLTRAKSDYNLIGKNLTVSDAALKQMQALQSQLNQLSTDYSNLATITDPSGPNAATIAVQNNAVPQLVGFEEMMNSGNDTMDFVKSTMNSLKTLITKAQNPSNDLTSLKSQFSDLVGEINDALNSAGVQTPDGTTQNILMNGSADTISVAIDANGTTVTMNRYDATSLQNFMNDAATAFNAVTDSSDAANLQAANAKLLLGTDNANAIQTQLGKDLSALDTTVGKGFFAASLNTTALMKGKDSVSDNLNRVGQIETLLKQIGSLATESKNRASTADRSDLETKFNDYRTQLRGLVENAGSGLDNFLNGANSQNYEIINGQNIEVGTNINLGSAIADVLDAGSLSDQSSATALESQAILLTNQTDIAKATLQEYSPTFDRVVGTYDPRGKLDDQVKQLKSQLDSFIASGASNGINLLDPSQKNISLDSLSTGTSLKFRAQTTFKDDFLTAITNAVGQLGSGNVSDVLHALDDVSLVVSGAKRSLQTDNRTAMIEYGKLGGIIDGLDPDNTSEKSKTYQTNQFTEKFLVRYLTQNAIDTGSTSSPNSYVLSLFGGSGSDSSSAIASIMNLSLSIKA